MFNTVCDEHRAACEKWISVSAALEKLRLSIGERPPGVIGHTLLEALRSGKVRSGPAKLSRGWDGIYVSSGTILNESHPEFWRSAGIEHGRVVNWCAAADEGNVAGLQWRRGHKVTTLNIAFSERDLDDWLAQLGAPHANQLHRLGASTMNAKPYAPDSWDLMCREQLDGKMIDGAAIRRRAREEAEAGDINAFQENAPGVQYNRAAISKRMYEEECDARRNYVARDAGCPTNTAPAHLDRCGDSRSAVNVSATNGYSTASLDRQAPKIVDLVKYRDSRETRSAILRANEIPNVDEAFRRAAFGLMESISSGNESDRPTVEPNADEPEAQGDTRARRAFEDLVRMGFDPTRGGNISQREFSYMAECIIDPKNGRPFIPKTYSPSIRGCGDRSIRRHVPSIIEKLNPRREFLSKAEAKKKFEEIKKQNLTKG